MVLKRKSTFVLPYLGKISLDLRTRLRRTIEREFLYCKLKVIFRSKCRLDTLPRFQDLLEKKISFGIIYHYTCSTVPSSYLLQKNLPSLLYPEQLNTWGCTNLQERNLKLLNSLQYLTFHNSVIVT